MIRANLMKIWVKDPKEKDQYIFASHALQDLDPADDPAGDQAGDQADDPADDPAGDQADDPADDQPMKELNRFQRLCKSPKHPLARYAH